VVPAVLGISCALLYWERITSWWREVCWNFRN